MTRWGWSSKFITPSNGSGLSWLDPFFAAVPWITLGVILLMNCIIGGALTGAKGVAIDLPERGTDEQVDTKLVALMIPMRHETLVFFDDARYVTGDPMSMSAFGEQLRESVTASSDKALLVLADRMVTGGDMMTIASIARESGVERILFAERHESAGKDDAE